MASGVLPSIVKMHTKATIPSKRPRLREYTYVPHGSGIVYIRSHERHAAEPRIATGRDLDVQGGSKRSVTVNCKNAYKSNGTLKNTS